MLQLCERGESTSVSSTLEKWFVPKKDLNQLIALKGDKEGSSSKPIDIPSSPKAHSPQLATCEHCNEDFDLLDNEKEICVRHTEPKYANMDSKVWDDHDEDCHGDPDDLVDEPGYAGGFFMNVVIDLFLTRDVHQRNTRQLRSHILTGQQLVSNVDFPSKVRNLK